MSYDMPNKISTNLGTIATTATVTKNLPKPVGKRGVLRSIAASVTTTTVGSLIVQVGVAGTLAKFGTLTVGALTAPNSVATDANTQNAVTKLLDTIEPGDTPIVTVSGGSAGAIDLTVSVDWF